MACILHVETSTKTCSLALSADGKMVFNRENFEGASHAANLGKFAQEAIEYARKNAFLIEAVAVSSGPGSYTGLRIGVSEAKGLCYGLDIPLIAIPSLKIMASSLLQSNIKISSSSLLCSLMDARRMEVYSAFYDMELNEIKSVSADIIDENSYMEYAANQTLIFFGDGSTKCRSVIQSPNMQFVENIHPLASAMIPLADEAFLKQEFVDVAYFEPFYLKEFQATVAKNKIIER